jgi:hypothetical protein
MAKKRDRNYREEYDNYHGKPEQIANRAKRVQARRDVEKKVGKAAIAGKDVDHKKPLRNGGTNAPSNLRVATVKANRGWNRGQ